MVILALISCFAVYQVTAVDRSLKSSSAPKQRRLNQTEYDNWQVQHDISFTEDVKPVLDSRCVVCHGCYDAPCQLKLSSIEGIDRGATKSRVYDTNRFSPETPTRLFIDAKDTLEWRQLSFFPVLDETDDTMKSRLDHSILARLLKLKRNNPLPHSGLLPADFKLGLKRTLECPNNEEISTFEEEHPMWGMPYAMPALSEKEEYILLKWLEGGAKTSLQTPLSNQAQQEIEKWESFFNGSSNKEKLVSRYIYEHLFIGHLHFKGHPANEFYQLVRSRTPAGLAIDEIETIRPYEDPETDLFFYRLRPIESTIVDKNHFVYELSDERLERYHNLFFTPSYSIDTLPSYKTLHASNPFKTFIDLPLTSRYQFLLDDARFFFSGFIKGPVCRGQVAINVIRDRFWVVFINPDQDFMQKSADFLAESAPYLTLPASGGDELNLFGWMEYSELVETYLNKKKDFFNQELMSRGGSDLDFIWDGSEQNPNAALTVFRHFDSATVEQGFIGDTPLTGWVVDYPIFERIHYLLVAGFNVYGSAGHQVATRKYMDFLRVEAENNFLRFLPANSRSEVHGSWHQGINSEIFKLLNYSIDGLENPTRISFQTRNHKKELFDIFLNHIGDAAGTGDLINRCTAPSCLQPASKTTNVQIVDRMRELSQLNGNEIQALPEISFLRVIKGTNPESDQVFTLIRDTYLTNVAFMFVENLRRDPKRDRLTVVPGFLGSYPNFFFSVHEDQLPDFIEALKQAQDESKRDRLYSQFGIRRTNPEIWEYSDWFNNQWKKENPIEAGLFDLNRYQNL